MRDMSRKLQNGRELALGISRNGRRRCDSWVCVCGLGCGVIASDTLTLCPERLATSADCIGNTPISRPTPPHKFFSLPASPSALYLLRVTGMTPGHPRRNQSSRHPRHLVLFSHDPDLLSHVWMLASLLSSVVTWHHPPSPVVSRCHPVTVVIRCCPGGEGVASSPLP